MASAQCTSSTSNTVRPRLARARCTASNTRTGSTGVDSPEASNSNGLIARGISARSAPSNRCEAAKATSRSGSNPAIEMTATGPARADNSARKRDFPEPGSPSTTAAAASALANASLKRARSAVNSEERPKKLPGTKLRLGPRVVEARLCIDRTIESLMVTLRHRRGRASGRHLRVALQDPPVDDRHLDRDLKRGQAPAGARGLVPEATCLSFPPGRVGAQWRSMCRHRSTKGRSTCSCS